MAIDVVLPKLGFSMIEGVLSQWLVADGAEVNEGQVIYLLESEKSVEEVVAPASGVLRISVEAGRCYQVGERLGSIE